MFMTKLTTGLLNEYLTEAAHCLTCGGPVEKVRTANSVLHDGDVVARFYCHGTTQDMDIDMLHMPEHIGEVLSAARVLFPRPPCPLGWVRYGTVSREARYERRLSRQHHGVWG